VTLRRLLVAIAACAAAAVAHADPAQTVVHMLDYVAVDYSEAVEDGKVKNADEYGEMRDFATQVAAQLAALPARKASPALLRDAAHLKARIDAKAPGAEIAALAHGLRRAVIAAYHVVVAPQRPPDVARGAQLYASLCTSCHGANGQGDGPAAKGLEPAPSNFHDAGRMSRRSAYALYNTITLGVAGTSMVPFANLPEDDRWALAFYVSALRTSPAAPATVPAALTLRDLALLDDEDAATKYGPAAPALFAYLKRNPADLAARAESPLAFSQRTLVESLAAYRAGDAALAQRLAVTAYLEGFELVEASLDMVDRSLRREIESAMSDYRAALREGRPVADAEAQATRIAGLLDAARDRLGGESLAPSTAAVSAFFILVREGLEALLVVAAIVAFLVKAGRRDALRYVHAGWIGALVLGILTWVAANTIVAISGANRELTEGFTALLAAAILLYVGFWLHGKAYADRWRDFIRTHLRDAMSAGTLWALAGVSFLAVYREAFETVLFYQALWQQAGETARGGVAGGFVAGAFALAAIGWAVFRFGMRLPIGPFFAVSSWLLAALAIVFVGHGIRALQEAGVIAATPVGGIAVQALGIYPTSQTLVAQAVVLAVVVGGFAYGYLSARRVGQTST
jgi:high-affinity iron transporter